MERSAYKKSHQWRSVAAKSHSQSRRPITAPTTCAGTNSSALAGAMRRRVREDPRDRDGRFAKEVEAVNQ